ncbi:lipopolysaccharide transport periplasmic protein LptA [Glaciecola sp. SC05]|uniref:lipopolysaccharide transport periplasmic protein LptA n=1 Tax=Glaciecola sp. SC05 TaxID=1987355 RepID=UPI003526FD09
MCKPNFILALSVALAFGLAGTSNAQDSSPVVTSEPLQSTISSDFNLPVTLDSKSQALDGKNKTSIFMENVVIRQGSLELMADKVEVNAVNGAGKEIISASGQPASYKQRKDDGSMVEAQANEIIYTVESRTISLNGNALIMQNEVRVTGDLIVFDMTREQILASTNDNSSESVRTVISPGAFSSEQELKPTDNQDQP